VTRISSFSVVIPSQQPSQGRHHWYNSSGYRCCYICATTSDYYQTATSFSQKYWAFHLVFNGHFVGLVILLLDHFVVWQIIQRNCCQHCLSILQMTILQRYFQQYNCCNILHVGLCHKTYLIAIDNSALTQDHWIVYRHNGRLRTLCLRLLVYFHDQFQALFKSQICDISSFRHTFRKPQKLEAFQEYYGRECPHH